jgi:hypothetical protein
MRIIRTDTGMPETVVVDDIGEMLDGFISMESFR